VSQADRLPRVMGPLGAAFLSAGWTIGSGIFRLPSEVGTGATSSGMALMLWGLGGVFALCGALCYAELAVRIPRSGGEFVYLNAGFGPGLAFLSGWGYLLLSGPASIAAVSRTFADYAATIHPLSDSGRRVLAAFLIAALATVAARSTRAAATVVSAATLAKLVAIAFIVAAAMALFPGDPPLSSEGHPAMFPPAPGPTAAGLALAFTAVIYAYDGFQGAALLGGEVTDPGRNIPLGLLIGTSAVAAAYLALNVTYLEVLGFPGVCSSEAVAADTMGVLLGRAGSGFVAGLVMVSTFGSLGAQLLGTPRAIFAMAEEGLFFGAFARPHPRARTPWLAITLVASMAILLVLTGGYGFLIRISVLSSYPLAALAMLAAPRLRRRAGTTSGFSMPLYPLPLAFFVGTIVIVWILSLVGDPPAVLYGVVVTALGAAVYAVRKWLRRA